MEHNFEYLRPSSRVHQIQHPRKTDSNSADYIMKVEGGQHKRKIFHLVEWMEYDQYQKQAIKDFKAHLIKQGFMTNHDDALYLRFLNSAAFNLQQCTKRLQVYEQWNSDPSIQKLNQNAKRILESGCLYSYGRDSQFRPIIFMNVAKCDFDTYSVNDYFCAYNNLLKPIMEYMFVPGKVENYVLVIDMEGKVFLPIPTLETLIKKLSVVYSSCLEKLFLVNANLMVKLGYNGVKHFVHPDTQKKVNVLASGQANKMTEFIPADELEQKYGGTLPNLTTYWPIQTTKTYNDQGRTGRNNLQYTTIDANNNTLYYSVVNDEGYFNEAYGGGQDTGNSMITREVVNNWQKDKNCCCASDSCSIF